MADVSSSTGNGGLYDIPDLHAVQRLLEEMDGEGHLGLSTLRGEDSEGFSPARDFTEVGPRAADTAAMVRDAAERMREAEELDVDEERVRDEGMPEAQELQRGFVYPHRVVGSSELKGQGEEFDDLWTEVPQDGDGSDGREGVRSASESVPEEVFGAGNRRPGNGAQQRVGPEAGSAEDLHNREVDEAVSLSVAEFLGQREEAACPSGSDETPRDGAEEPLDLVGFIRAGLEGNERAVFDRVVASFEAEAKVGDATAYDFLLLCGFTATIARNAPVRLAETVKGLDSRLVREVGLLQKAISETKTAIEKMGSIPQEVVKISTLLGEMTARSEFHLIESNKLHAESVGKFNAVLKETLSGTAEKLLRTVGRRAKPLGVFTAVFLVVLSLVTGFGLSTLMEAGIWQRLKVKAMAEADMRAEAEAEAFRQKEDAAQPERSMLARLQENGLVLTAQPGSFTDLYEVPRKALILSLRSIGPQKLSKVTRNEREADVYFSPP